MTEKYPPLPELEITEGSATRTDQETVDIALKIIYKHRPDFYERFAEKERLGLWIDDKFSDEFDDLIRKEVLPKVKEINNIAVFGSFMLEACRRARIMYSLPPYREINMETGEYE